MCPLTILVAAIVGIQQVVASPAPQGASSHAVGCSDACYSAIATYDSSDDPYAGNGICWKWLSSYPPAHTTTTITQSPYEATVSPTTFSTRSETVWTMSGGISATQGASPLSNASPTAVADQARRAIERRQTTSAPTATPSVQGLPLPNSNIVTSCNNDPAAFASACSCIGDYGQTSIVYATTTISSTTTQATITRECTSTATATACAATASYGLQRTNMQFGDSGESTFAPSTIWSNSTTAAECCEACFISNQNCRFFSYTRPADANNDLADGGVCSLNLEGSTCPYNQLPPSPTIPYSYNYITEGMYLEGESDGAMYGFGPCAQEVPYFYGYENFRDGVGQCSATTAVTTVTVS